MKYEHPCQTCRSIIYTDSYFGPVLCPVCLAAKNQREKDAANIVNYVSNEAAEAAFAKEEADKKANAITFVVIAVIAGVILIPIFLPLIIMAVAVLLPIAIIVAIIYGIVSAINSQTPKQGP